MINPPDPLNVTTFATKTEPKQPLTKGTLWLNVSTSVCSVWTLQPKGFSWAEIASANESGFFVTISNSSPKNPQGGTLWYNPVSKSLSSWAPWTSPESWIPILTPSSEPPTPSTASVSETPPSYPLEGQLWFQPSKGLLQIWIQNSGKSGWEVLVDTKKVLEFTAVSGTPPVNPKEGDLWFDTTSGFLYVRVTANGVGQWVIPNQVPVDTTPVGLAVGLAIALG